MNLKEYLTKYRLSYSKFEELTGISRQQVSAYIKRKHFPSGKTIQLLIEASHREITLEDLLKYFYQKQ